MTQLPPPQPNAPRWRMVEKHWTDPTTWPRWAQWVGVIVGAAVVIPVLDWLLN